MATGLWKPNIPNFTGANLSTGYEDLDPNGESYEGKSVLILGECTVSQKQAVKILVYVFGVRV